MLALDQIQQHIDELDAAGPKEDAELLITAPDCEIIGNYIGYLRSGIEMLKAAVVELEPGAVAVDRPWRPTGTRLFACSPTWSKAPDTDASTHICATCTPVRPSPAPPPPRSAPARSVDTVDSPTPLSLLACAPVRLVRAASNLPLAKTTHVSDRPSRCRQRPQTSAPAPSLPWLPWLFSSSSLPI